MLASIIAKHIRRDMRRIEESAENGVLTDWMRDLYHRLNVALAIIEELEGR